MIRHPRRFGIDVDAWQDADNMSGWSQDENAAAMNATARLAASGRWHMRATVEKAFQSEVRANRNGIRVRIVERSPDPTAPPIVVAEHIGITLVRIDVATESADGLEALAQGSNGTRYALACIDERTAAQCASAAAASGLIDLSSGWTVLR